MLISFVQDIGVRSVIQVYHNSIPLYFTTSRNHCIWMSHPLGGLLSRNAVRIPHIRAMAYGNLDFLGKCSRVQVTSHLAHYFWHRVGNTFDPSLERSKRGRRSLVFAQSREG